MALPHQSIATINSPEFINLQPLDINPLMSSCEIKVLYIGENRNHSFISKDVATEMAKSLRGAPIVGYYKDTKEDFADHGQQMIIDDQGIHFNCLTKPYGFVAPDAKVWFQKFNDSDDFGNVIEREYLMTTGYLWTGQFEEVSNVLTDGKPQSMELDENSLNGHWATNPKNNIEFFIINDAIFSKLCILGDQTEPCFEGAAITAPDISTSFSATVDENFKHTLFTMISELKDALKGGYKMEQEVKTVDEVVEEVTETTTEFTQEETPSEPIVESALETSAAAPEEIFEQAEEEKKEEEVPTEHAKAEDKEEEKDPEEAEEEEKEKEDEKYALLQKEYAALEDKYNSLNEKYQELLAFKLQVEDEKKDALIKEFYMLSDEDKAEVIANKANYSLDEIKAKLAVICYEKKVNFNSDNNAEINDNKEEEIITYTYTDTTSLPDWVKAVKQYVD